MEEPNPPALGEIIRPTIGLGAGTLSYFGNIYTKHRLQPLTQSRFGYELNLMQPLMKGLYLNFNVMFGQLGANARSPVASQNQNFQSQIRLGGIQFIYDFSNFINKQNKIRPYILCGVEGFEFLTKTDMYDRNGNRYYYWNDGTIRNMAQGSANSQNATLLTRDYTYDSDVRESNQNGYGKYRESAFSIPWGAGFTMNAGDHLKFRMGVTVHSTNTKYIDGVGANTAGSDYKNKKDQFVMFSASVNYDLYTRRIGDTDTFPKGNYEGVDWLAIDNGDEDKDGVKDWNDSCHATPAGVKVDAKGCPVDEDKDLVADYRDDELPTAAGMIANGKGVGITDEMAQYWYDDFYDSTGVHAKNVGIDNANQEKYAGGSEKKKDYTVELVRYKGGIPSDEMAYLLSIGDVRSFTQGDTTVVYAAGSYKDVKQAAQRRDEFKTEGLKSSKVGYFKGSEYKAMSESELQAEIDAANKQGNTANNGGTPYNTGNNANTTGNENGNNANNASEKGKIIYRVQLGAYKSKLSPSLFKNVGNIIELKTEDGYYKYASGSYKSISDAAAHKAELVYEGYSDAFITAYQNGKRIPLSEAGVTYEAAHKNYRENLSESANTGSAVDKSLVKFKIQFGAPSKTDRPELDEQKDVLDISKEPTSTGLNRYTTGNFKTWKEAEAYKKQLLEKGFNDVFVIATFKGEVISIQEAQELLK